MTTTEGAFYWPPLEDLPTFDVLVFRNAQDVVDYAISAGNVNIINTTSGATYYPTFVDASIGYENVRTNNPSYTYDANTNTISANTSGTAAVTSAIALTSDNTAGTYYVPFSKTTSATSNALYIDDVTTPLTYNPSTSALTATKFNGLASQATTVTISGTVPPDIYNIPFCSGTGAGTQLLSDTILQYDTTGATPNITADLNGNAARASNIALTSDNTAGTYYIPFSKTTSATSNALYIDDTTTPITYNPNTSTLTVSNVAANLNGNATRASNIALTSDNTAGTYYIPFSKTTSATSNALYIDDVTTPLTYNPDTSTLTVSNVGIRTTIPSTISASGANIDIINNNVGGVITMNNDLSFTSTSDGSRQINNTYYNLYDTTAVPSGGSQGRIYSDTAATYIEGYVGNHNIIGTENSTVSSRQLFNFGSTSADLYPLNIRLGSTSGFNIGIGAGSLSNLIIGSATPKTIVFTTGSNTFVGTSAGQNATIASASNTCFGNSSGPGLTTGVENTFIGNLTGFQTANGTGPRNVCVGFQAGDSMINNANENTIIGARAGAAITTGTDNVIIGFDAATSLTTGSNNIVIGSGANVIAAAVNQIAIGTVTETMFIQGGFNWRVGTQITSTATGNLATAVLAQFYTVAMTAAGQTIALPNPATAVYLGARVTFKRKTNTTVFTITSTGGAGFVPIANVVLSASPISIGVATFQVDLVCDGVNWCIIGQA